MRLQTGDNVKAGILNRGLNDKCSVSFIDDTLINSVAVVNLGQSASLHKSARPSIDLILAVPRPNRLERLLPVIGCLGVDRVIFIGANKVEKHYFGKSDILC